MKALDRLAAPLLVAIVAAGVHAPEPPAAPGPPMAHAEHASPAAPLALARLADTHARGIPRVRDIPAEPNPIPTRWTRLRAIWAPGRHVVPDRQQRRRAMRDARGRMTLARPTIIPDRSLNSRGTAIAKTTREPGEGPRRARHRLKAKEAS
ncbi:MAG TPA: hypothetical protein VJY35_06785 [Candidatus Eisenbacteria bacterium]|nr:hypothetical protein [Candidatus Eisenbacteria bacterium]